MPPLSPKGLCRILLSQLPWALSVADPGLKGDLNAVRSHNDIHSILFFITFHFSGPSVLFLVWKRKYLLFCPHWPHSLYFLSLVLLMLLFFPPPLPKISKQNKTIKTSRIMLFYVCVCVRGREKDGKSETETGRENEYRKSCINLLSLTNGLHHYYSESLHLWIR